MPAAPERGACYSRWRQQPREAKRQAEAGQQAEAMQVLSLGAKEQGKGHQKGKRQAAHRQQEAQPRQANQQAQEGLQEEQQAQQVQGRKLAAQAAAAAVCSYPPELRRHWLG